MSHLSFLLIEVLPAFLLMLPLLWIKYRRSRIQFLSCAVFLLYLCGVYALVGLPTVLFVRFDPNLSVIPFAGMIADLKNTILNILLFIPLGLLLPQFWPQFRSIKRTMLFGLCMTLSIELLQILTYRATDINDILTNLLGTFLGYILSGALSRKRSLPLHTSLRDLHWLLGVSAAGMFFLQPLLSAAIWSILP